MVVVVVAEGGMGSACAWLGVIGCRLCTVALGSRDCVRLGMGGDDWAAHEDVHVHGRIAVWQQDIIFRKQSHQRIYCGKRRLCS